MSRQVEHDFVESERGGSGRQLIEQVGRVDHPFGRHSEQGPAGVRRRPAFGRTGLIEMRDAMLSNVVRLHPQGVAPYVGGYPILG